MLPTSWRFRFEFVPRDVWIGAFWKPTKCRVDGGEKTIATDIYVCLIPCVPLHITVWWPVAIPIGGPDEERESREFDAMNGRRIELAEKITRSGLTEAEAAEFNGLQSAVFAYIGEKYPRPVPDIGRLDAIERRLRAEGVAS